MIRRRMAYLLLAVVVVVVDVATKSWIRASIDPAARWTIIPNFLQVVHFENRGVVFGLASSIRGSGLPLLLAAAAFVVLALIAVQIAKTRADAATMQVALHMIAGGAVGNIWNRLQLGAVTDFIDVYVVWRGAGHHWPAFNLADAAISSGVVLLLMAPTWRGQHPPQRTADDDGRPGSVVACPGADVNGDGPGSKDDRVALQRLSNPHRRANRH